MATYNQISRKTTLFHSFPILEEGSSLAGYSALIQAHDLKVPLPDYLCAIGLRHKRYDCDRWHIFTPRHKPDDSLYGHLTEAIEQKFEEIFGSTIPYSS